MSRFSAEWLELREPYDIAARNPIVLDAVRNAFRHRAEISVVDLACGTGSTLRVLQAELPARQRWNLVDNDASHLEDAAALTSPPERTITTRNMDLVHQLDSALSYSIDFVTTSALLDLVSSEWLGQLIIALSGRRLPFYAALTYDGRAVAQPIDSLDVDVIACFNSHQLSNKGFGPALGPAAACTLSRRLADCGYLSVQGSSDWVLGTHDRAIQEAVFAGWATAAAGTLPRAELQAWLARRLAHLAQGRSTLRVGHIDCFAYPMGMR